MPDKKKNLKSRRAQRSNSSLLSSSNSSLKTFPKNSRLNLIKSRVTNVLSGIIHFLDRFHANIPEYPETHIQEGQSEGDIIDSGNKDNNSLKTAQLEHEQDGGDYEVLFRNNNTIVRTNNNRGRSTSQESFNEVAESRLPRKSQNSELRRRRSSRTRSKSTARRERAESISSATDLHTNVEIPKKRQHGKLKRRPTSSNLNKDVEIDSKLSEGQIVEEEQLENIQKLKHKKKTRPKGKRRVLEAIRSEGEIIESDEPDLSGFTPKTESLELVKKASKETNVHDSKMLNRIESTTPDDVLKIPKPVITYSDLGLNRHAKKKFSLLDLRKNRVERGIGIKTVDVASGFILRREKIIRKSKPKKNENPIEAIQRGLRKLLPINENEQPNSLLEKNLITSQQQSRRRNPNSQQVNLNPYNDVDRKRQLFQEAASTLHTIDSIAATTPPSATRNSQKSESQPVAGSYFPQTPYTAQYAHLLPRPRNNINSSIYKRR